MKKFKAISNEVEYRIISGIYPVNSEVPSESSLANEFNVNRHTVRQAVKLLSEKGLLDKMQGRRSIVKKNSTSSVSEEKTIICYRIFSYDDHGLLSGIYRQLINQFQELHPAISVELRVSKPTGSLMMCDIPEASGSDIPTIVSSSYVADYASKGMLVALDEFVDFIDVTDKLIAPLIYRTPDDNSNSFIHSLPVRGGAWMNLVNVSLLEKLGFTEDDLPDDWEEMFDLFGEIVSRGEEGGITPLGMPFRNIIQSVTRFLPYIYSANGGKELVESGTYDIKLFDDSAGRFLDLFNRLNQAGALNNYDDWDNFINEKTVFSFPSTLSGVSYIKKAMKNKDVRCLPIVPDKKGAVSYTVVRGDFAAILKNTVSNKQEKYACWEFIKFLLKKSSQLYISDNLNYMPVRNDISAESEIKDELVRQFYNYALKYGKPAIDIRNNDILHSIAVQIFSKAVKGDIPVGSALSMGREMLKDEFSRRRTNDEGFLIESFGI
ncbi:MAG: ABC transporter substrate-binding protein [Planctomycetota bacterium]|jgi:ABC-type glycerol-3-phosphate transport system substrate-binding protein